MSVQMDMRERHLATPQGWTEEQLQFLKTEWPLRRLSRQQICDHIGKKFEACRKKAHQLGLPIFKSIPWDDALVETVTKLRNEGLSASQIASQVGLTRNAVIGKMNRIGVPSPHHNRPRLTPEQKKQRDRARYAARSATRPSRKRTPKFLSEPLARQTILAIPESEWVPFLDNTGCRAIMHDDDKRCCGRPIAYRSYCAGHAAIYYTVKR